MAFKTMLALLATTLIFNTVEANDFIYTGSAPEKMTSEKSTSEVNPRGPEQIRYILDLERGVRTVGEAMELKTRGLMYVQNIYDFEYLTSCPFASPSEAYIKSVGDFIVQYVGNYLRSPYELSALRTLESRVPHVGQAIAVKSAALRMRLQIQDYVRLIAPAVNNPSDSYRTAISNFTAQNINRVLDSYSPIYMIVEAERCTLTVGDAMAVKNAGLVAVRTQNDLFQLATYSVPNPSDAYRQAVNNFIQVNIGRYPRMNEIVE